MEKFKFKRKKKELFRKYKPTEKGGHVSPEYDAACRIRSSDQWQRCRALALSIVNGMCVYCYKRKSDHVHHIKGVSKHPDLAFELENLAPLCETCHGWMEARAKRGEGVESQIRDRMEENIGFRKLKINRG
jgi:5-methylcytosine-specific restriction endonuclease McrA